MKSSSLEEASILVNPLGTCTITVRLKPFTSSESVVVPGDVAPQPFEVAAAAHDVAPPPMGTATSTRREKTPATPAVNLRVTPFFESVAFMVSPSNRSTRDYMQPSCLNA